MANEEDNKDLDKENKVSSNTSDTEDKKENSDSKTENKQSESNNENDSAVEKDNKKDSATENNATVEGINETQDPTDNTEPNSAYYQAQMPVNPLESLPQRVFVAPVFGRPFLPGQVLPVSIFADPWQKTIDLVLKTPHKTMAIFCLPTDENGNHKDREEILKSTEVLKHMPKTGCLIRILHARSNENEIQFIAEGVSRVKIDNLLPSDKPPYVADVSYPADENTSNASKLELKAHAMAILNCIKEIIPLNPMYSEEVKQFAVKLNPNKPAILADCATGLTTATGEEMQNILETYDTLERLKAAYALIQKEVQLAKLQSDIKASVDEKLKKRQRDYYLREQLKSIKEELGVSMNDNDADVEKFKKRMEALKPSKEVLEKFTEEIEKYQVLEHGSPEYAITRNHLDWLTQVPWGITLPETLSIENTRKVLDEDHEALTDVKERIVEFVAVGSKKGSVNGSIILFVGPPGVGKTSVGKSIARALNRPFFRFSVGGLHDEAEIKGHRRTYIGALPGKLVQALKQTKCMNPVIMLDEIDKITRSNIGDPASALLETLDPEQNSEFLDHYIDARIDLSKCLFICTANSTDTIPGPLLDRMDVISLSGYLADEKLKIAKHHLIPKTLKKAGLTKKDIKISDTAVKHIINEYAREAGVRHLEKLIEKIIRKAIVKMIDENLESVSVGPDDLHEYLKSPLFRDDEKFKGVGIATGLAWTSMGGATIPIEAIKLNDSGAAMQLTGSLGDVMKESANISYSYAIANIGRLCKAKKKFFDKAKIHLHVPEGATPKDGPSAGITMATALLSLALGKAPTKGYAMTGELTLTGRVLAIGGIREKSLAAKRLGIKKLICPKANENDVKDLPDFVSANLEYHFVDSYDDVAKILFPSLFKDE